MKMTKQRWIVLILAVVVSLGAFGAVLTVTVQVTREVPSTVTSATVLADENLGLYHDPDGIAPVTSLNFARLQPPLDTRTTSPAIYIRNESNGPLRLIDPCRNVFDSNSGTKIGFQHPGIRNLGGTHLGSFCGRGVTLAPGEMVRTDGGLDVEPGLPAGEYSFTTVFGAVGEIEQVPPDLLLYVGNEGNSSITQIDPDGNAINVFEGGGFGEPFSMTGLAFDPETRHLYYAAPKSDGNIWRLDADGNATLFADQRPDGSALNAFGLAFSPEGELHATLLGTPTVIAKFDDSGTPTIVHTAGTGGQALGFAINSAGEIFWAHTDNDEVRVATGPTTSEVYADSSDGIDRPFGIAFDSHDRLYVANFAGGGVNVQRFDAAHSSSVFADPSDGLFAPIAVAVDSAQNVFVANYCSGQQSTIIKFDPDGNPISPQPFADGDDGLRCSRSLEVGTVDFLP